MRLSALLVLCSLAWSGDLVYLRNGRQLGGKVIRENEQSVVVDVGGGEVTLRRSAIRLIERGAASHEAARRITRRDEYFLVLHGQKLVGWRRVVHTEGPRRAQVEERTVFFRPGGGQDVEIRRVEIVDPQGRPLEFLLSETYGRKTEMVSGQVLEGKALVRIRRAGKFETRELELPQGWTLALPAWSRFLASARPGETKTIIALDPRYLRPVRLVLRRDADTATDARPCRALSLVGNFRVSHALYRPGEGSLFVQLNGETLVARRVSRERVEMARRVNASPRPLSLDEAVAYPFFERPRNLTHSHVQAGLMLTAPDAAWIPSATDRARGLVLSFEKVSLFASVEVFAYALPADCSGVDDCLEQALGRLRLTARRLRPTGKSVPLTLAGRPARRIDLVGRHRGESLHCSAAVVHAQNRYLLLVAAAPERWWHWAARDFDRFLESLDLVP